MTINEDGIKYTESEYREINSIMEKYGKSMLGATLYYLFQKLKCCDNRDIVKD
jgi:hypothetical protein